MPAIHSAFSMFAIANMCRVSVKAGIGRLLRVVTSADEKRNYNKSSNKFCHDKTKIPGKDQYFYLSEPRLMRLSQKNPFGIKLQDCKVYDQYNSSEVSTSRAHLSIPPTRL